MDKPRVAIIGSGNIGIDLAERLLLRDDFQLIAVIGRRPDSPGLMRMRSKGVKTYSEGIEHFLSMETGVDGFFDATSAFDHIRNWNLIKKVSDSWIIDLTPSRTGVEVVPILDEEFLRSSKDRNFSMVTCGGQSSGPILAAMCSAGSGISEVEISSSIASDSAGPATRRNLDHYISATESIAARISSSNAKAILVLNPSIPQVMMRTSVTIKSDAFDIELARTKVEDMVSKMKAFVPNYKLVLTPTQIEENTYLSTVSVEGEGLYLPKYSGNLDIINAAAVATAEILGARN
jgi:acetaldehyde dehydrogenase (acetylating)